MIAASTLLAGLGSPFGDDQLGWRVVDNVAHFEPQTASIVRLRSADQLLDRLSGVARLVVCDACQGAGPVGSWHRWRWPDKELAALRCGSTHDLGLAAVLTLAERLGQLPPSVTIWAVEGARVDAVREPGGDLSPAVEQALFDVAARIAAELHHA